jgi:hypothetical protein
MKLAPLFIAWMLILSIFCISASFPASAQDDHPPRLNALSHKPSAQMFSTKYIFQVKYFDADNDPPSKILAVLNNESYNMQPLSYMDTNYTDGKIFFLELELEKGMYTLYFEASDGKNSTFTDVVIIQVPGFFDTEHGDIMKSVVFLTPIFVVLVLLFYYQGWKLTKSVERLAGKKEGTASENMETKEEKEEGQKDETGPGEDPES